MAITAFTGPIIAFGITQGSTGQVTSYNDQRGPSMFDLGQATLDPRPQFNWDPGGAVTTQAFGLWDQQGIVDYIPFTAGASAIVISSNTAPVSGATLTLTPISSNGAIRTTIIAPETGQAVSVIAIDSTASVLGYGQSGSVAIWNPAAGTGRAITVVTSCANTNSEVYIVRGRDMYGFKMTENIVGSTTSTGTGTGNKAFKYIQSIVVSTTVTVISTGVSIGFADKFGFPILASYSNGITVWVSSVPLSANSIALSSANVVLGSTTAAQTATTNDVRGTYTSSIATSGTSANTSSGVRVTIYQPILPTMTFNVTPTSAASVFGATQFSDF